MTFVARNASEINVFMNLRVMQWSANQQTIENGWKMEELYKGKMRKMGHVIKRVTRRLSHAHQLIDKRTEWHVQGIHAFFLYFSDIPRVPITSAYL